MNRLPGIMKRDQCQRLLVGTLLILATTAVYWQVVTHEFTNFDDPVYVTDNPRVRQGLTLDNIVWAFTTFEAQFWHPLTWLSHMADWQLYGAKAGGHHLTNLLLHLANTLVLFVVLRRMTGAEWRSGMVAGLFALHPLHVESVAWVAERKDVLSTLFWMLTLWAYSRYAERDKLRRALRPNTGNSRPGLQLTGNRLARFADHANGSNSQLSTLNPQPFGVYYSLALVFFTLGLMSKPMLVTLPFVLLLLDLWPLRRFELSALKAQRSTLLRLLWEKIPFWGLATVASAVAFYAQKSGGTLATLSYLSLGDRMGNALVSYVRYLGKLVWPSHLAVYYPHPATWPLSVVLGACLVLLAMTGLVVLWMRLRPYLAVGWFWYVGTLVPVIGLVQVGNHAMADRYTYVPLIGMFILVIWVMAEWVQLWRCRQAVLVGLAAAVLAGGMVATWFQIKHWKNNEVLFRHALAVTSGNYVAHDNLGVALAEQGRVSEGIEEMERGLQIKPDYADGHNNLGIALCQRGRISDGIGHLEQGLRLKSGDAVMYYNLGTALWQLGKVAEAIEHYQQALRLKPDYARARTNLGIALFQLGEKSASSLTNAAAVPSLSAPLTK